MQKMVDNEDRQDNRKLPVENPDGSVNVPVRRVPNRNQRRKIAKRRGVFKTPGLWPYINKRSTNRARGDNPDDTN